MDAKRIHDGKVVMLKRVPTDGDEMRIATYFSSHDLRKDPRNHCVPILDLFQDPDDPATSFLVMPLLRYIDNPEFDTVGSILECVRQLLEVRYVISCKIN